MAKSYIAVFDSGLGGLCNLKALQEAYPNRDFVFLADNAQLPLGDKPKEKIIHLSLSAAQVLSNQEGQCQALIIACGTSSAHAASIIQQTLAPCPIFEMIGLTTKHLFSMGAPSRVGVLATAATVASNRYLQEIHHIAPSCHVIQHAAPALVPLIEGATGSLEAQVAKELSFFPEDTEAFILGCTHYSLIKNMIQNLRPKALVVDSPPALVNILAPFMPPERKSADTLYLCTLNDSSWEQRSALLLGRSIAWNLIKTEN